MKKIQLTALLLLFSMILPLTVFAAEADSTDPAPTAEVTPTKENETTTNPFQPSPAPETAPETTPEEPVIPPIQNKATLISQNELRAGEIATFTLRLYGDQVRAIQGKILFDSTVLSLEECKVNVPNWSISFSAGDGSIEYLGLNTMGEELSGENDLVVLTFRVSKEVTTDFNTTLTVTAPLVYNGTEEIAYTGDTSTVAIAPPFSTNCTLTELKVAGGAIFPAFAPDILEYSVTLPFVVETALITAIAADEDIATIQVSNTTLAVGSNTIDVTVISQAGTQQVYTIHVTRSPDPNYIPSADNRILALTLTEGLLFPAFSPDVTKYSVYMVRGQEVTIHPIPTNKAVASSLYISDDTDEIDYTIVCTAENGTTRSYVFSVILLETPKQLEKLRKDNSLSTTRDQLRLVFFIAIGITLFFLGFVFGIVFFNKRKKSTVPTQPTDPDSPILTPPGELSPPSAECEPPTEAPPDAPVLLPPVEESPTEEASLAPPTEESATPEAPQPIESSPIKEKTDPVAPGQKKPPHSNHSSHKHKKKHKKKH